MPSSANSTGTEDQFAGDDEKLALRGRICRRIVLTFDSEGRPVKNRHKYTFHSFEHVSGRTIRDLPFSHPRQLADVLPVSGISSEYAHPGSIFKLTFLSDFTPVRIALQPPAEDLSI